MLMKKFFTFICLMGMALAASAQNDFPLQYVASDGNVVADGTTLTLTAIEEDAFGGILMPSGLGVANTSSEDVVAGSEYTISTMTNGAFQTCFPENCIQRQSTGTYQSETGTIAAGALKDMQTEWLPDQEGTCVVQYQLLTYKYNKVTKKYSLDGHGPKITLRFIYDPTSINGLETTTKISSVNYFTVDGRRVTAPVNGVYVVKVKYADGNVKTTKQMFK